MRNTASLMVMVTIMALGMVMVSLMVMVPAMERVTALVSPMVGAGLERATPSEVADE